MCGGWDKEKAIQLLDDEKSERIIHHDKNEPLTFVNWQLWMWCYFCEALVIQRHSWRDSSSSPTLQTSLGKYNSDYDLWLWLLTLQTWNKHMPVDMVAGPLTPVSLTGGGNSCRHSGFQILCSCRGCVTFHNQPKGSQVLTSSLSSDSLNVSGRFAKAWHQGAHGSGCCVWVNVDDHISGPFFRLACGHQTLEIEAFRIAVLPDFCLPESSSLFGTFNTEFISSLGQYFCLKGFQILPSLLHWGCELSVTLLSTQHILYVLSLYH